MRDVNEGYSEITLHPAQLLPHLDPQLLIERGQRLVQQQHHRAGDRGTCERDTLLLPAGQLRRQPVGQFGQPDLLDHRIRCLAAVRGRDAAHPQREGDIIADVQMWK